MRRNYILISLVPFLLALPLSSFAFTLFPSGSGGPLIGWTDPTITFDTDFSKCPAGASDIRETISAAMNLWNGVSSSALSVQLGATVSMTPAQAEAITSSQNPVIMCDQDFKNTIDPSNETPGVEDVVPAYAQLLLKNSSNHIGFGIINMNAQSGAQASIDNMDRTTLEIVLAHEMGHILGLGHAPDEHSLMYFDITKKKSLHLSMDDMNGITYLYPRKELSSGTFGCGTINDTTKPSGQGPGAGTGAAAAETVLLFLLFFSFYRFSAQSSQPVASLK